MIENFCFIRQFDNVICIYTIRYSYIEGPIRIFSDESIPTLTTRQPSAWPTLFEMMPFHDDSITYVAHKTLTSISSVTNFKRVFFGFVEFPTFREKLSFIMITFSVYYK